MSKKKKVGILGGTFNPIHVGHLLLAETAYDSFGLDYVLIMPNGNPPHKELSKEENSNHRMEMLQLSVKGNSHLVPSDFELKREGVIYTYKTLELLCQENPETVFYFILGADSLIHLEEWQYPERICKSAVLLVAVRDELNQEKVKQQMEILKGKYQAEIYLMDMPAIEISSSDIRKRIREGRTVRYQVLDDVREYIQRNHLYE